ncbi:MAG: hypothetical protein IT425_06540 [Pirellulales bacterium]|nr:hypothetical protein [Pirellulales bacterium]
MPCPRFLSRPAGGGHVRCAACRTGDRAIRGRCAR